MSNVTVLQTAANRFSSVAGFAPIAVDGNIGAKTLAAVQRSLDVLIVEMPGDDSGWIADSPSEIATMWRDKISTSLELGALAFPIGQFLLKQADRLKLPAVAAPYIGPPVPSVASNAPLVLTTTQAGSLVDAWRGLATWKKIALGAFAGFLLIFLHGRYKTARGLSGSTSMLHLFTYKNRYGSYSDVWAHDAEHAREQIKRKKDRPSGFYTISRVTNVPARRVA